jgi:hypothetical protein
VFTALCGVFATAEVYLYKLTLAAMGMGSMTEDIPVSVDWLAAGAVLSVAILWGAVLIDLYRGTHLLPTALTHGAAKRPLMILAWGSIASIAVAGLLIGAWRTHKLIESSTAQTPVAYTQTSDGGLQIGATQSTSQGNSFSAGVGSPAQTESGEKIELSWIDIAAPMAFNIVLAVLILLASLVSFIGPFYLIKYLSVLVIGLFILPLAILLLVLRGVQEIVGTANILKDHLIDFLANLGGRILSVIGPIWDDIVAWTHERVSTRLRGPSNTPRRRPVQTTSLPPTTVPVGAGVQTVPNQIQSGERQDVDETPIEGSRQSAVTKIDDDEEEVEDLRGWDPLNMGPNAESRSTVPA